MNVISVEYLKLVGLGCLTEAIRNTYLLSMCVTQFINTLLDYRTDIRASDIHVVAFGLGVPVALQMENITQGLLGEITGELENEKSLHDLIGKKMIYFMDAQLSIH